MGADADPPPRVDGALPLQTVELLDRVRAGNGDAIGELFRRYGPRVRGLAAVRMGRSLVDMHDCDDVVQETMLAALRKLDQFRGGEGSLVCWLATIVETHVQNAQRSARTHKRGGGLVQRRADLGVTTISNLGAADAGASPSQVAAAGELDGRLERALLGLDASLRQIVYCRLVLDMGHAEIAAVLGLASGDSARALFHKAVVRLRERLDGGAAAG
ncbi:MAG TPA: sigma-70 family RNA polymerase sigma factor [Planctomycetota bacterium]